MTLKLYGFRFSSCTRRVAVVCKELNVPYELIPVDITKGEQRSAEHLARQPFGLVPTIEVCTSLFLSRLCFTHMLGVGRRAESLREPCDWAVSGCEIWRGQHSRAGSEGYRGYGQVRAGREHREQQF
jgi:hypothetical protein